MNCDKISYTGKDYPQIEDNYEQVMSEQTAYQITTILEGVIKRGTGKKLRDLQLNLAGKTGTPQDISKDSSNYGYGKYKNHGWFTAYYPFNAPRIAITVFAEHGDSGGRAGGPIIKKIVSYYKEKRADNKI